MNTSSLRSSLLAAVVGGAVVAGVLLAPRHRRRRHKTTTVVQQCAARQHRASRKRRARGSRRARSTSATRPGWSTCAPRSSSEVDSPFDPGPRAAARAVHRLGLRRSTRRLHPHQRPRDRGRLAGQRPVRGQQDGRGQGRGQGHLDRPRAAQGGHGRPRPQAAGSSATPSASRWAIRRSPSATRSGWIARSPPASCRPCSAASRRPNGYSISNVIQTDAAINPGNSGRPAARRRRPGDRDQLPDRHRRRGGRQRRHRLRGPDQHRQADDSRSSRAPAASSAPTWGSPASPIDRSLDRLNLATKRGVLVQTVQPGSPAAKAGMRGGDARPRSTARRSSWAAT